MGHLKRIHSFWTTPVRPLGIAPKQFRIVDHRKLTDILLKQYGDLMVVQDEGTRTLEHCGKLVTEPNLKVCLPRTYGIKGETSEVVAKFFGIKPTKTKVNPTDSTEPGNPVEGGDPVDLVKENEGKAPTKPRAKRGAPRKKRAEKSAAPTKTTPSEKVPKTKVVEPEPPAADLNPFE